MPPCQELWSQWLWRHYISYLSFLNWNNLGLVIVPYNNGTLGSIDPWLRCKPVLSSLCSVHRSPILWLSRWISANKQSHQVLRIMSSNWQILWYHYAKSFEANDSDATTSFTCHFKTKPIWGVCLNNTTMQWLVYCFGCQGEKVHSNQANDPDAWCQATGNDYDAIMPRALKLMTLRQIIKSQSWGPAAGADTFKIKVFHKISISICLQKVEILKKESTKKMKRDNS